MREIEQNFDKMMRWALGDDYESQNIKEAPLIWKLHHPELCDLQSLNNKPSAWNIAYHIYQISQCWFCKQKREEAEIDTIAGVFKTMWFDFKQMFK